MTALSKFAPVSISCVDYVHPWQPNCTVAHAGLVVESCLYSARTYTAVYLLSMLMRGRWPTATDCLHTLTGIARSTAFLTTNSFTFCMFLCILRRYAGHFNFYTFSFVPSFIASLCAILIERPSRRGLLALYTANNATEVIYNMLRRRGHLSALAALPGGRTLLFAVGSATLLWFFRRPSDHSSRPDSIFGVLRFVVGSDEQPPAAKPGDMMPSRPSEPTEAKPSRPSTGAWSRLASVQRLCAAYASLLDQHLLRQMPVFRPHSSCPHRQQSCALYALRQAIRLFAIGLAGNALLRTALQAPAAWRLRSLRPIGRALGRPDTLRLGALLGAFAGTFRVAVCALRRATDGDRPAHGFLGGLLAGLVAFRAYPDGSLALYAAWKGAQLLWQEGETRGWLPNVPHADVWLYCFSTAMLFHAGIMEPMTLRPSYFQFLHSVSGSRLVGMNRDCMEPYGLDTVNRLAEAMRRTNIQHRVSFEL